ASSLEAEVASELERRGATPLVMQDPSNELQAGNVSPRSVRRFSFARDVDAVVIGQFAEGVDGSEGDFEVDVYSGQSGVRLGHHAGRLASYGGEPSDEVAWSTWVVEALAVPIPDRSAQGGAGSRSARPGDGGGRGLEEWLKVEETTEEVPLQIDADSLEVFGLGDRGRRIRFYQNVRVVQGKMVLLADELEAFYSAGRSEPERLVAKGDVRIEQGDRRARCQMAEYERSRDQVICSGDAVLIQDCDTVRGQRIEIELSRDRARVIGAASVVIGPETEQTPGSCAKVDS
ncbi:MAG: LptA/OstA family protein, partial [Myxococcota bacterium]